jgi:hypothetical protein
MESPAWIPHVPFTPGPGTGAGWFVDAAHAPIEHSIAAKNKSLFNSVSFKVPNPLGRGFNDEFRYR